MNRTTEYLRFQRCHGVLTRIAVIFLPVTLFWISPPSAGGGDLSVDNLTVSEKAEFYGDVTLKRRTNDWGLVFYYNFDSDITPVPDVSGHGHDGTVYGATWTPSGAKNGAYVFDGSDDYIESADYLGISGNASWTMSCWVKYAPSGRENENFVSIGQAYYGDGIVSVGRGGNNTSVSLNLWCGDNVNSIECGTDFTASFVHVVVTYDGSSLKTYANGVLKHVKSVGLSIVDNPVRVGGRSGGTTEPQYLNGWVDEVKIYVCALSAEEVAALYQTGSTPASGAAPKLLVESLSAGAAITQTGSSATNSFMGKVGVGTATPEADLHVAGTGRIDGGLRLGGALDMNANRVINVAAPQADADAVALSYMRDYVAVHGGGGNVFLASNNVFAAGTLQSFDGIRAQNLVVGPGEAAGPNAASFGASSAGGIYSLAQGSSANAVGHLSHAEGLSTYAAGLAGHAEGCETTAEGDFSHSEGLDTRVSGMASYAGGVMAKADHDFSFVWSGSDENLAETRSTAQRQFTVYAKNGIRLLGGPIEGDGSRLTCSNVTDIPMGVYTNR